MLRNNNKKLKNVYLVAGLRSPQLKVHAHAGPFSASDLAVQVGQQLLISMPFAANKIEQVIMGCVIPAANEANIARQIAYRLGCGDKTTAYTVQRNCASGMQAIDSAMTQIRYKHADLILCGGTEAMSHSPLLWQSSWINWLLAWKKARFMQRLLLLTKIKLSFFRPVISLMIGLTDPLKNLSMGQTAEMLATKFSISRSDMDEYALQSNQRLAQAQKEDVFKDEIHHLFDMKGHVYKHDDGLRTDGNKDKLSSLNAVFDKYYGQITAANSAQITDGASLLLLASEKAVRKYKLKPLAKLIDCEWQGVKPEIMGIGAAHAIAGLLKRKQLALKEVDYWEINEAFAAQVLACIKALKDKTYCQTEMDIQQPLGEIPLNKLNIDGGGISLGHPVGSSGARLVLHLANILKRKQVHRGLASMCIGGGQGGAILLERQN
jgi:acetyl-CoA C-acetyltransferase